MQLGRVPEEFASELRRVRELSKNGQNAEALAAAEELTRQFPENRDARYLVAANQRCLGQISEALVTLQLLEQKHPGFSLLYQERGHCYVAQRNASSAVEAFWRAVSLNPALIASWTVLDTLCRLLGDAERAAIAAEQLSALRKLAPEVVRAGSLFSDDEFYAAENILTKHLLAAKEDVEALRLLGRIKQRLNQLGEAESLLAAALAIASNYDAARFEYIRVLLDNQKYSEGLHVIDVAAMTPSNKVRLLTLKAVACAGLGQHEQAADLYCQLLQELPQSPELHVALGHCLKSSGRTREAIDCYQKARSLRSDFGDAYWSLANLKTYRFAADEIADMCAQEDKSTTRPVDRYHLCFALGKAHEDQGEYAQSWEFYNRGNAMKRVETNYDPGMFQLETRQQIDFFSREFFASREGVGSLSSGPIFIVGLPSSGSTLIEQILASHSQVEGTQELPEIQRMVSGLRRTPHPPDGPPYPALLCGLPEHNFALLGERYLTATWPYRRGKASFVDKMPNNFRHIGLIHLVLPNAKIIDVRREPMACCFSNLKQLFASGQEFSYSMEDVGRYYRGYLELMQHWDSVLPGRVLRVYYEDVVSDLATNIERILKYCGLECEPACLEFYKTGRSVHTPSSEQVRRPIFRQGLLQWRNYEPWLGRLKYALGDALTRYRESPTATS